MDGSVSSRQTLFRYSEELSQVQYAVRSWSYYNTSTMQDNLLNQRCAHHRSEYFESRGSKYILLMNWRKCLKDVLAAKVKITQNVIARCHIFLPTNHTQYSVKKHRILNLFINTLTLLFIKLFYSSDHICEIPFILLRNNLVV